MFISIGEGRIINLNNIDRIAINWDDEFKGTIKFVKCLGSLEIEDSIVGTTKFNTKKEMEDFIDKYIIPLQENG